MDFGNTLKKLRLEKNLTQQKLADIVGISKSSICHYEKSKKIPSPAVLAQFASFFEVPLDYLMGIESPTNGKTLSADGLTADDIRIVQAMIDMMRERNIKGSSQ